MALLTLARPCWTYTCAADHHDHTGHRTHSLHRSWLRLPADCDRPYELPAPCVTAFCDSCGAEFHHPVDPGRGTWHFPTLRLGPLWLNLSKSGLSWSIHLGPWSWNSRTRAQRVDLPGPFSWRGHRH